MVLESIAKQCAIKFIELSLFSWNPVSIQDIKTNLWNLLITPSNLLTKPHELPNISQFVKANFYGI